MLKTRRRALHFDSLEGKVLLSIGMANPGGDRASAHGQTRFLNGSVSGLPDGTPGVDGYTETSFPVSGHLASDGSCQRVVQPGRHVHPDRKLPISMVRR